MKTLNQSLNRLSDALHKIPLQLCQTIAIGSFLLLGGKAFGYVDISWLEMAVVFSTVIIVDVFLRWQIDKKWALPFAAINTGIGISLFLRSAHWPIYVFTGAVAIISKYLIRIDNKHFFNPSYSAIFIALVLFPKEAYVNHFQWGNEAYVLIPILLMGSFVAWRAKVWDAVITFFVVWFVLLNLFMEYSTRDLWLVYLTGAFFIMAFHGFTDPATLPKKRSYRLLFVTQIAILFFILRQYINEGYSFFAAYFLVNTFEMAFWYLEQKQPKNKDWRLWIQGGLTLALLAALTYLSVRYYILSDGGWPILKSNRCAELFCQYGLTPLWGQ